MDVFIYYAVCIFAIILGIIGLAKISLASIFSLLISITVVLAEVLGGTWTGTDLMFGIVTIIIGGISLLGKSD